MIAAIIYLGTSILFLNWNSSDSSRIPSTLNIDLDDGTDSGHPVLEQHPMIASRRQTKRYLSVDALRGIAAVMVMLLHIGFSYHQAHPTEKLSSNLVSFLRDFDLGRIGITIFFLVSGFVIPKSIQIQQKGALMAFAIKRFFRLYPLFWFSMIVGLYFLWYLSDRPIHPALVLTNLTMMPSCFHQPFIIGLYWSLETELSFYMLVTLLLATGYLRKLQIYLFGTLLALLITFIFEYFPSFRPNLPHWTATPFHLCLMFLGAVFRHFYDRDEWSFRWRFIYLNTRRIFWYQFILVVLVPLFVITSRSFMNHSEHMSDAIAYLTGLTCFFCFLYLVKSPPRPLIFLGMISYSMYLLHPVVIQGINYFVDSSTTSLFTFTALSIFLTIVLSALTYRLIEKPFISIGRQKVVQYRKELNFRP